MFKRIPALLGLLVVPFLSDCLANPYYDPGKPHHTEQGFRNNHSQSRPGSFWKWQWERYWEDLPQEPEGGYHPHLMRTDAAYLSANGTAPTLTWIGHATLLLQYDGVNILTDPHLTERASPFGFMGPKRRVPPALTFAQLPHIDVVVISHNHYDHLDEETVKRLSAQPGGPPRFLVPLGLKAWFADLNITTVEELDWWEHRTQRGLTFVFVPAQHFSARTPFDRNQTLWGGWAILHPGFRFYFAGDTGYSEDFAEIGRRLGPFDLAAIPIGAYAPRWFMKTMHVNPEEAVQIHRDVRARYSVAIHWGTFQLTDERIDEPPTRLAAALKESGIAPERFTVMAHGETRKLAPLVEHRSAQTPEPSYASGDR